MDEQSARVQERWTTWKRIWFVWPTRSGRVSTTWIGPRGCGRGSISRVDDRQQPSASCGSNWVPPIRPVAEARPSASTFRSQPPGTKAPAIAPRRLAAPAPAAGLFRHTLDEHFTHAKPAAVWVDGHAFRVTTWQGALQTVARHLVAKDPARVQRLLHHSRSSARRAATSRPTGPTKWHVSFSRTHGPIPGSCKLAADLHCCVIGRVRACPAVIPLTDRRIRLQGDPAPVPPGRPQPTSLVRASLHAR